MNNVSLKEFAAHCVVREVAKKLSPAGLDATMLISLALKQAIQHYYKYGAELANIELSEEDILARLSEKLANEIRYSTNKKELVKATVNKHLKEFKLQTAGIIKFLEMNLAQIESASPKAELQLTNLQRAEQGYKPLKRLPKKKEATTL